MDEFEGSPGIGTCSLALGLLGIACCANTPYQQERYGKENVQPTKIEHREQITKMQFKNIEHSFYVLIR